MIILIEATQQGLLEKHLAELMNDLAAKTLRMSHKVLQKAMQVKGKLQPGWKVANRRREREQPIKGVRLIQAPHCKMEAKVEIAEIAGKMLFLPLMPGPMDWPLLDMVRKRSTPWCPMPISQLRASWRACKITSHSQTSNHRGWETITVQQGHPDILSCPLLQPALWMTLC